MKQSLRIFSLIFGLTFVYSLLTSSSGGRATVANAGNTGAPTESTTCISCHNGGGFGLVTLSIQVFQQGTLTPVAAYLPGTIYDMRVTVQNSAGSPNGYGFQLTSLTQANNTPMAGYSNLAANVKQKLVTAGTWAGRTYLEHSGVTNSNIFNFRWTAPQGGTGAINFYAAGNAVNLNSSSQGDNSGNSALTLPELQPLGITGNVTSVSCNGGSNGTINVTVSGGNMPYTYDWGAGVTTEDRTGLAAGTYTVIVTDNSGSSIASNYTVAEPTVLVASAVNTPIVCNGGTSTVSVSGMGGTFPYTGTGGFSATAGSHTYTITDANGCVSAPITINIAEPAVLLANAVVATPISCNGGTAVVTISANGGTAPYSNIGNVTVLGGSQSFNVIDANGCMATTTLFVSEPPALNASVVLATPIDCYGGTGTVTVAATGGTAPYTNTGLQTVSAGTGSYMVTDVNGCSTSTPPITVNEPSAIVGTVVNITHNTGGNNGAINVSVVGGTPPYSYSWSNGATTQDINQLAAGLYTLTITDAKGCVQIMTDLAVLFQVGIETALDKVVNVYPNPAIDYLYLDFEAALTSVCFLKIYNIEGKIVGETAASEGKHIAIEVAHLPVGSYFLWINYEGKMYQYNWAKK